MSFGKKKKLAPPRRLSQDIEPRSARYTYSYRNSRSDNANNFGRQLKDVSQNHIRTAKRVGLEKFGLVVLSVVIVICLLSVLYLSNDSQVMIVGNNSPTSLAVRYKGSVRQAADKLLASSLLNHNKITVNTTKITSELKAEYPMYSNISISLPFINHHPVVYLTPAQAVATLVNTAGQYLVNQDGQIMARSSSANTFNSLKLPAINYSTNQYLSVGQQILTVNEMQFIQTIAYELNLKSEAIASMTLPQGTSELNVYLSGLPYYAKFNLENNDPTQQVGSFLAAQHYLKGEGVSPSQYIDVRVDGRVYYQ